MAEKTIKFPETSEITIKSLLQSGAHFGTKRSAWHPRMAPYIYGMRDKNYIINLDFTVKGWGSARAAIVNTVANGGQVLVVCTQEATRELTEQLADDVGFYFVNHKWLGGTLTNFSQLQVTLTKLNKLEIEIEKAEAGDIKLVKKEILRKKYQRDRLLRSLKGLRTMKKLPNLVFVMNPIKEYMAVRESRKLLIPIAGLSDTNMNPKYLNFPIPANDDANSTIALFLKAIAEAVREGKQLNEKSNAQEKQNDREQAEG